MHIHAATTVLIPPTNNGEHTSDSADRPENEEGTKNTEHPGTPTDAAGKLDQAQIKQLDELKQRDREVRTHEMAHLAAAGSYALGGPTFEYQKGPDGQRYAIGGHVNIDTSPVPGDPEATLRKAETIQRAALAPAEPSPQDRSVAAAAASMAIQAQVELMQIRQNGDERSSVTKADSIQEKTANQDASVSNPYLQTDATDRSPLLDLYG